MSATTARPLSQARRGGTQRPPPRWWPPSITQAALVARVSCDAGDQNGSFFETLACACNQASLKELEKTFQDHRFISGFHAPLSSISGFQIEPGQPLRHTVCRRRAPCGCMGPCGARWWGRQATRRASSGTFRVMSTASAAPSHRASARKPTCTCACRTPPTAIPYSPSRSQMDLNMQTVETVAASSRTSFWCALRKSLLAHA